MRTTKSESRREEEFLAEAEAMYKRLRAWRAAHPGASFDEIGDAVGQERQQLMGRLLGELASQPEETLRAEECCRVCGAKLEAKGKRPRRVSHVEGEVRLEREYQYCKTCASGIFPPRRTTATE